MSNSLRYCPKCDKDVKPVEKMFGAMICPECNRVLDNGRG